MTDREIIRKIAEGDIRAFEHIYLAYRQQFVSFLWRSQGVGRQDALDIFQEACAALYNNIVSGRLTAELLRDATLKTYLFAVGKKILMNRRRKQVITLSSQDELILNQYQEEFRRVGFVIEPFGGREYAISEVPANLYGVDEKELFVEMLSDLGRKGSADASEMICQKLASMSCKAAIKGGQKISFAEADALIDQLLGLKNPYMCPHDRPTLISISRYELEKKFKRIV